MAASTNFVTVVEDHITGGALLALPCVAESLGRSNYRPTQTARLSQPVVEVARFLEVGEVETSPLTVCKNRFVEFIATGTVKL